MPITVRAFSAFNSVVSHQIPDERTDEHTRPSEEKAQRALWGEGTEGPLGRRHRGPSGRRRSGERTDGDRRHSGERVMRVVL
jgi:hypothetical protein